MGRSNAPLSFGAMNMRVDQAQKAMQQVTERVERLSEKDSADLTDKDQEIIDTGEALIEALTEYIEACQRLT